MAYKILIADDHPLFRDALATIVHSIIDDCEIDTADDYLQAKNRLEKTKYKLLFLDLNMPNTTGLSDLALLKKQYPSVPIVVVSAHDQAKIINTCMSYNASGYIIKSSDPSIIKSSIKRVLEGEIVAPEGIGDDSSYPIGEQLNTLTPCQLKVFGEMVKGKLNKQIAYDLEITEATVKAHITTIFKKLGINNRSQAVLLAQQHITDLRSIKS